MLCSSPSSREFPEISQKVSSRLAAHKFQVNRSRDKTNKNHHLSVLDSFPSIKSASYPRNPNQSFQQALTVLYVLPVELTWWHSKGDSLTISDKKSSIHSTFSSLHKRIFYPKVIVTPVLH